ncbi:MAG: hypothetical protein Q9188_001255, partial [Gyalolechia gomerana]
TDSDSNILKIYRMLDRSNGVDAHYYQPGIGTYVDTHNLSHTSTTTRLISWYKKAKDAAVGTSFDSHVMGAYKFLMRCYQDDDIYIFGFSRGAYLARFLAEMLDQVGLLSNGNEEMAYFAWKAFSQWQERLEESEEDKKKKKEMYQFLKAFRETFSRPVRRIRFMGLFDTGAIVTSTATIQIQADLHVVNSVPRFENAWMQRSKFPYTATAVEVNLECTRRGALPKLYDMLSALMNDSKAFNEIMRHRQHHQGHHQGHHHHHHHHHHHGLHAETNGNTSSTKDEEPAPQSVKPDRFRRPSQIRPDPQAVKQFNERLSVQADTRLGNRPTRKDIQRMRSLSPGGDRSRGDSGSPDMAASFLSLASHNPNEDEYELDEAAEQDIEELWFPGCHADLGGGWPLADGEESALSHAPLVWMIREAQRAGLELDRDQMLNLHCCDEDPRMLDAVFPSAASPTNEQPLPTFNITTPSSPDIFKSPHSGQEHPGWHAGLEPEAPKISEFHQRLHKAATKGVLHDCLQFNNGLPRGSVLSWKIMEYLPFRRLDLQPDGSWKAITFPLPMGEVRDIPEDAKIHHSAIRRMEADENYRPGNLIVGGGGRGVRKAPKELGIGEWVVHKNKGDPVGEVLVRKGKSLDEETKPEGN